MRKIIILSMLAFLILVQVALADITLDKDFYKPGETVNIQLSSSYSFDEAVLTITNPLGESSQLSMAKQDDVWILNYNLGDDAVIGTYTIDATASQGPMNDPGSTKSYFNKNFDVVIVSTTASDLVIEPDTINEIINETVERSIDLQNFGDSEISISEVIVLDNLLGVVSIVERPYAIQPNSKATLKIRIDPSTLNKGSYSGTISILSDRGATLVYVNLQVTSNPELKIQDYSFIIWAFAVFIVLAIIVITVLRYRKLRKKKKLAEKNEVKEVYSKPVEEEYRTEYY